MFTDTTLVKDVFRGAFVKFPQKYILKNLPVQKTTKVVKEYIVIPVNFKTNGETICTEKENIFVKEKQFLLRSESVLKTLKVEI